MKRLHILNIFLLASFFQAIISGEKTLPEMPKSDSQAVSPERRAQLLELSKAAKERIKMQKGQVPVKATFTSHRAGNHINA